jgi:hypothetical protein
MTISEYIPTTREWIAAGLIALAIWAVGLTAERVLPSLDRRSAVIRPAVTGSLLVVWLLANVGAIAIAGPRAIVFFVITSAVLFMVSYRSVRRIWAVGIQAADTTISSGTDYTKALRLCKNHLDFLGTGGSKLTAERAEFEQAVRRCNRPDRPIRLLLLDLNTGAEELQRAATQAGFDKAEYRRRVVASLRVIADLKTNRSMNIEVRFYERKTEFRLMFIDDYMCLASYNIYGEGSGSQLPQLHLIARRGQRDVESFYYPFRTYFDRMWSGARPWNFHEWL